MLSRLASALALAALFGCDQGHPHPPEQPAGAEEKTAQITVWSDRFEIFLEHKFIVAETPTAFVTHVSDLKTLEPRRKDPVVFVLRQGDAAPIEHLEPEPKRAGIYIPDLKFPRAGEWAVTLRIPVDGGESIVNLPKLTVYGTKEEARKAPEPEAPEGISFLKEQQWKVLTKAEPVGKRRLVERVRVPAAVAARPGSRAAVTPPVAGRILAPGGKSLPSIGDRVEAGQTLALVQPPFSDFAAKIVEAHADSVRARLAVDQATLHLERVKKLAAAGGRTEKDLQEAEFALKSAEAARQAASDLKATYEKAGAVYVDRGSPALELQAPIAGVIEGVSAAVGEFVPADRSIFTILDTSTVYLEARVPEQDLARLAGGKAALYELPARRGTFVPLGDKVRLVHAGRTIDPVTRTAPLFYEYENPEGRLRIGESLTLHLETQRAEEALAIPASAVVEEEARPIAFVQLSGETFDKRSLKLGIRDGEWIQVLEGLAEGERVVTKEAFAIRLASVSGVIPAHGHAH